MNTYQAQFPEMRKKIDKRGRKLIDYDAERHAVQQMQNNPNRNEAKFVRAKEQMENAKRTYEVMWRMVLFTVYMVSISVVEQ